MKGEFRLANIMIAIVLLISVVTDVRQRKILNVVTLPAILLGFLFHGVTSGLDGLLMSGLGFLVGLGLLIIPFIKGGIGAGDVKLLAAVGAWKGAVFVIYTTLFGAAIGGIISLFILLKNRRLRSTLQQTLSSSLVFNNEKILSHKSLSIPYAVPLAIGAILAFVMEAYM